MLKISVAILIIYIVCSLFTIIAPQASATTFIEGLKQTAGGIGYKEGDLINPNALPARVGQIVSLLLISLGVIFLVYMIYGGYIWMIARSNAQSVEKAKEMIKDAVVGLLIVLAAYAITSIVTTIWK